MRSTAIAEALERIEITFTPHRVNGQPTLYLEWTLPPEAHQVISDYCQKHHIDTETYLTDVAGEVLLKRQKELEVRKRQEEKKDRTEE